MRQINNYKIVGWDVDTQRDFMEGRENNAIGYEGKLKINDAMTIAPALRKLSVYLRQKGVPIMGSVDWHDESSVEFSSNPDFVNTFPPHCIAGHYGAEKIDATRPENPIYINPEKGFEVEGLYERLKDHEGEVFFRKDRFDVFDLNGNPYSKELVKKLGIEKALVYGVALEVCDDYAIKGLLKLGVQVYAVEDAMKALNEDSRPQILQSWQKAGAKIVRLEDVLKGKVI